jgi:hypothetical protein
VGVTFDAVTDVLSGKTTQIGKYEVTFTAHNGVGPDDVQHFTLTVLGLHVTTTSLPTVTPGASYSKQLEAAGGIPPYKWKATPHELPKGLRLSPGGLLHGKVSAKKYPHGGSFSVGITVIDHGKKTARQQATETLTLNVS